MAEAGLFRIRWSAEILTETEHALGEIFESHGLVEPSTVAARQIAIIQRAFPDALVDEYAGFFPDVGSLPDPNDARVIAAVRRCRASVLVTENILHFPRRYSTRWA